SLPARKKHFFFVLVRYTLFMGNLRSFQQLTWKKQLPLQIFLEEATVLFWWAVFLQPHFFTSF
ncbi:hypothetical protein, partial [Ruminococcus sp.]|uniref:hypothetical protein n=1 Tax=Ruminococcus sp. TaxID=41978 RepID=UPI001B6B8171